MNLLSYLRRAPRWLQAAAIALAFAVVAAAGAVAGVWIDRADIVQKFQRRVLALMPEPEVQTVEWRRVSTHYHQLDIAEFAVADLAMYGGAVEAVGDDLVIASPQGRLTYLSAAHELRALGLSVPINIEGLHASPVYEDPRFMIAAFRTHDMLAVRTSDSTVDLYVSHDRFRGDCIEFVVSRAPIRETEDGLEAAGEWSEVWVANPCLRFKDRGAIYEVGQGGRMVQHREGALLVAVGDYQRDGFFDSAAVSMDADYDHGKIVELDLDTGNTRHFAIGLRNPQGLAIASDGVIWESEHGPQGGDELNVIVDGANYGWPQVTYGMTYGTPPGRWPANERVGNHAGYEEPRFAFLPSIAPSQVAIPDEREFPNWRGTLLLASLAGQTLFVVRTQGTDVTFIEPIRLDRRLRDIAVLEDGTLAILADRGALLLVRNAERHEGETLVVSGLRALPAPYVDEAAPEGQNFAEEGRIFFSGSCASCHSLAGESGVGPPLDGVVGRDIASVEGYNYSPALERMDGRWTAARLRRYLADPQRVAPGTTMTAPGLHPRGSRRIVEYLRTVRRPLRGDAAQGE